MKLHQDTIEWVIATVDRSPCVTWAGKGGVKELLLAQCREMDRV